MVTLRSPADPVHKARADPVLWRGLFDPLRRFLQERGASAPLERLTQGAQQAHLFGA